MIARLLRRVARRYCPDQHLPTKTAGVLETTIRIDLRPFTGALERFKTQINAAARAAAAVTALPAFKAVGAQAEAARRQRADLEEIRALGRLETRRALNHLDWHVAGLYADLGLDRPTR